MTRLGQTLLIQLSLASLCIAPLAFADHQDNLISIHDDNITLIDELITISLGLQGTRNSADRCGQSDCPSDAAFSASTAAGGLAGSLGSRIDQARGQSGKSNNLGGSASADDSGRWSPFVAADIGETDKKQTTRGQAYTQDSEAFLLGFDYQLRPDLRGGASLSSLQADTVIAGEEGEASSGILPKTLAPLLHCSGKLTNRRPSPTRTLLRSTTLTVTTPFSL